MVESLNWTSEFSGAFRQSSELYRYLGWEEPSFASKVAKTYPLFIPRSLADRIKKEGPAGILAKQFLPSEWETDPALNAKGSEDPIGDQNYFRAPQLIHRYTSRALFTPTTVCPVHCRYCFRKNELNAKEELFQSDFEETLQYLKAHPEISEIIFTGGDPFTLSDNKLIFYLEAFAAISTIKDIRFHTRYPVILPQRFDSALTAILHQYARTFRTLTVAVHVNHVNEIDEASRLAMKFLSSGKIQLLSQTVLLKGVNDTLISLTELFNELMELRIRPYYLHHPDRVKGGMHFYLPLEEGRKLYQGLRDLLPGWALPQYVIDIPDGFGKVQAFNPETTKFSGQLIGRTGEAVIVQEPDFFV